MSQSIVQDDYKESIISLINLRLDRALTPALLQSGNLRLKVKQWEGSYSDWAVSVPKAAQVNTV